MTNWIANTSENLISQSQEKYNFEIARKEWFVTGNIVDYLEDLEPGENFLASCELCGKENLRWHYEIANSLNRNKMLVGSSCITKFEIPFYKDGYELNNDEKEKELALLLKEKMKAAKQDKMIESLRTLWLKDIEYRDYIKKAVSYYKQKGAFTPKQLSTLFWRLQCNEIKHSKSDFKIRIKSNKEKQELIDLEDWQIQKIQQAFNKEQALLCDILRK